MGDQIRMDSHKLMYHPHRVSQWMEGKKIYPIEAEISPSGACNHRCTFCALDYIGYKPSFLRKEVILRDIGLMHKRGLKSVVCAGEGEPLLNKELPEIVNRMNQMGLDVAMSSNAVLFREDVIQECLASFTWIRFSVASMEESSYKKIHRCADGDLDRVKTNLAAAVAYKKAHHLETTLGVQCLLIPDSLGQIVYQAKQLREIGVDYFTVKPYMQHLQSYNRFMVDYESLLELEKEIREYETEDFRIYFRAEAMKKVHQQKKYRQCLGLPFMAYIDAAGNVWPCSGHIGTDSLCYGNINENTFEEIWNSEKRVEVMKKINSSDLNKICFESCRLDSLNQYLDELKHPGAHVNFI